MLIKRKITEKFICKSYFDCLENKYIDFQIYINYVVFKKVLKYREIIYI